MKARGVLTAGLNSCKQGGQQNGEYNPAGGDPGTEIAGTVGNDPGHSVGRRLCDHGQG